MKLPWAQCASPGRRSLALLLLALCLLPVYRLLDTPATGLAGSQTLAMATQVSAYIFAGTLLLVLPALLLARIQLPAAVRSFARRAGSLALHLPLHPFSLGCALVAFLFAWYVNQRILAGQPNVIDAVTQLVHARYLAAGMLAGPVSELTAFWHVPLMVVTPAGWVSQYPPMHVLLLGLGLKLGVVELVGPTLLAATVYLASLTWHRLFPTDPSVARFGTLLLAFSPFAAAHAAAYMSHTTAALLAVLAIHAAVRLRDGAGWAAAVTVGLALGALLATRPLAGVVTAALLAGAWLLQSRGGTRIPARLALGATALGAAPPVLLLLLYNRHFFGSPFRFGYTAAFGPSVRLGFGIDPWNNSYGLREALAYTSADLTALNLFLVESPVPVVALVALFFLVVPRLGGVLRFIAAWALLPVAANALYWHHGLHMGPRMLNEYAPAWCLLTAAAAVDLVRRAPLTAAFAPRWSPRAFAATLFAIAWGFGIGYGAPHRLASYRQEAWLPGTVGAHPGEPGLVFVHGAWSTRVAMQLAASGMRLDSVETIMSRNSTCEVQQWLEGARAEPLVGTRTEPALPQVLVAPDSRIRLREGEELAAGCVRQGRADRFGVDEVGMFVWRTGLPGIGDRKPVFARDLGPEANGRLIRALQLPAWVLRVEPGSGSARLWPYQQAMRLIWGSGTVPAAREGEAPASPGGPAI